MFYKKIIQLFLCVKPTIFAKVFRNYGAKIFCTKLPFVVGRVLMGKVRLKFLCQERFSRYWSLAYQIKISIFAEFYLIFSGSISVNPKHPFLTIFKETIKKRHIMIFADE